jgi:hypothetical protein
VLTDIEQTIQVTLNKHYRIRSGDLSSYRCACGAAPWLDSHLASELSKAVQPLHDAAKALVDKLDLCIPAINGQFVIAHIHGMDYKGPTFGVELEVLRAVLAAESDAKHSSPEPAAPASDAPTPETPREKALIGLIAVDVADGESVIPEINEALEKLIREREAAAVAAAYQKAAERVRKFATEAYHEGIESHGPAREDWLRRSNDAERYAKAVETLADSAPKDATR